MSDYNQELMKAIVANLKEYGKSTSKQISIRLGEPLVDVRDALQDLIFDGKVHPFSTETTYDLESRDE